MKRTHSGFALAALSGSLLLGGCGQGSDRADQAGSDPPAASDSPSSTPGADVFGNGDPLGDDDSPGEWKTGRFIDSAVSGLAYDTGSQSGITDQHGTFRFVDGETITFYLGDPKHAENRAWSLGSAPASSLMTPLDLSGTDTMVDRVLNTVRLLQSLDTDRDPDNGITLSFDEQSLPDGNLELVLSASPESFAANPVVTGFVQLSSGDSELLDLSSAVDHFQITLNEILGAPDGSWVLVDALLDGAEVTDIGISLDFSIPEIVTAGVSWHDNVATVVAGYSLDELSLGIVVRSLEPIAEGSGAAQQSEVPSSVLVSDIARMLPDVIVRTLFASDVEYRRLPNILTFVSSDGNARLEFQPGETTGNTTAATLQLTPVDAIEIALGDALLLQVGAYAANSAEVNGLQYAWQSSDPAVVTISDSGRLLAVGIGTATVSVHAAGLQSSLHVSVVDLPECSPESVSNETDSTVEYPDSQVYTTQTLQSGPDSQSNTLVEQAGNVVDVQQTSQTSGDADSTQQSNEAVVVQSGTSDGC